MQLNLDYRTMYRDVVFYRCRFEIFNLNEATTIIITKINTTCLVGHAHTHIHGIHEYEKRAEFFNSN